MKPRVHSQPSPTAPVWLNHRKLGSIYLLFLLFLPFLSLLSVSIFWGPSWWISSLSQFWISVLSLCHTPPSLFPWLPLCHSQWTILADGVQMGSPQTHGLQSAFLYVLEWYVYTVYIYKYLSYIVIFIFSISSSSLYTQISFVFFILMQVDGAYIAIENNTFLFVVNFV